MRLRNFFFLTEMPKPRGDAMWATLDWASQQKGTFTIRDLYRVYVANGGRADSIGDNIQSFSTQINHYIAKPGKYKIDKRTGQPKDYSVSQKRPILRVQAGSQGGAAALLQWGLDRPLRDPSAAKFVGAEDEGAGEAMDRLETMIGPDKLKAAMARWQQLPNLNAVVADIKASIPRKGQMDALHIASDTLMDQGKADQSDVEDAEDEVPPAPQQAAQDDEEEYGDFSDQPPFNPDEFEDDEESPITAAPTSKKPPTPPAPEPEPEEEPEDEVEPPTAQQAGAGNFLKPQAPAAPPPTPPKSKSPVGKFFKKKK